jgi:hypothetical protein
MASINLLYFYLCPAQQKKHSTLTNYVKQNPKFTMSNNKHLILQEKIYFLSMPVLCHKLFVIFFNKLGYVRLI